MTISEEQNNSIIVIEANNQYLGCLHLMKTNLFHPVDGMFYTILTPTSTINKNNLASLNEKHPQSILYFQYAHELADYYSNDKVKNKRNPLIRLQDGLYIPKEVLLNTSTKSGRKITLLQANSKLNRVLEERIINTLKIRGR